MKIAQIAPLIEAVPPQALWRHRTDRVVPDRGAGPARARRDAVRQRRFAHFGASSCHAPNGRLRLDPAVQRPAALSHADARRGAPPRRRVRRAAFPHRHAALSADARASPRHAVTTLHGRLDLPDLQPFYRALFRTCRWSRSPTTSAGRCRSPTGSAPSITACRATCCRSDEGAAATSPSSAASRPRSAPTGRSRSPRAPGMPLKIAAKVDAVDRAYWRAGHRAAAAGASERRVRRRDRRAAEGRVPRRRARAAVPDRLAGAVRPGDDRGDGLRHAGDRLPLRLGAGGDRRTACPASSWTASTSAVAAVKRGRELDRRASARSRFERRFSAERMARDYVGRLSPALAGIEPPSCCRCGA